METTKAKRMRAGEARLFQRRVGGSNGPEVAGPRTLRARGKIISHFFAQLGMERHIPD